MIDRGRNGSPYMMPGRATQQSRTPNAGVQNGANPTQVFIQNFNQFRDSFNGDPMQKGPEYIQQLMNSGQMSQEQWNGIVQRANQLRGLLPM